MMENIRIGSLRYLFLVQIKASLILSDVIYLITNYFLKLMQTHVKNMFVDAVSYFNAIVKGDNPLNIMFKL